MEFLALDSFTLSLSVVGSILVIMGWLTQLIRTVFKHSSRLKQSFVLLYVIGTLLILIEQFPGQFSLEFILLLAAPLLAFITMIRLKR
jgi:hypothetical protein